MNQLRCLCLFVSLLFNAGLKAQDWGGLMEDMFNDSQKVFERMDRMMQEMEERFLQHDSQAPNWFDLLDSQSYRQKRISWSENARERILNLEIKLAKDSPLDIKIENGHVLIQGSEIREFKQKGAYSRQESSFRELVLIPGDVDADKAKVESVESGVQIRFPKIKLKKANSQVKPLPSPQPTPSRPRPRSRPLRPNQGDLVI